MGASIVPPVSASCIVRCRPILGGRLAVPPAPGISPNPTSGSANVVPASAITRRGERRQLDARPHARTVNVDLDTLGELCQQTSSAAREAHEMGCGRIAGLTELGELAAARERGTGAVEHDAQLRGSDRQPQRVDQRVADRSRVSVVAVRPVERHVQPLAVDLDEHRRRRLRWWRPAGAAVEPRGELGSGLQQRIHRRLGNQRLADRPAVAPAQQQSEGDGGPRCRRDGALDRGDDPLVVGHDVECIGERVAAVAEPDEHGRD